MGKRHKNKPECGSRSGYDWHRRDAKELPCELCRQAEIMYWRNELIRRGDQIRANGRKARAKRLAALNNHTILEKDILNRYGTTCHICKQPIDLNAPRQTGKLGWEKGLHIDHVIPLSRGGDNTIENVRPSHGYCNITKNATILNEGRWLQEKLFD
jgi:5-methylcytosine-specific restriction endonuclease McrA